MPRNPGGTVSGFKLLSTPDAPTITGVTTSIGSASVAFTAPTDTGDGAITSYVVTAVNESSGVSTGATGASSPITISPGGGTFKIRMQALNPYGPGRLTEYDTGNAIYSGAELYAWGKNDDGQIGNNTGNGTDKSSPVQIGALTDWLLVSGGENHSASIKTDNTLWTWGSNGSGRLGDNTTSSRSSPVQIGILTNWNSVSAGREHTQAVKTNGTLWAWGRNNYGQLGDNTVVNKSSPVQIGSLTNWYSVFSGKSSSNLSIKTDGTLWAWGYNVTGVLGDGTIVNRSSPVQVGALSDWAAAGISRFHSIAVKTNGTLWSWGKNNGGQLGHGNVIYRSSPVQVGALTNWASTSAGGDNSSAIKEDNTLWTWGLNSQGQIGDNTTYNRSSPIKVGALTDWSSVSVGGNSFMLAIKTNKTLWAWGNGFQGQLGNNQAGSLSSPVQIGALTDWHQVSTGTSHTLALLGVV